MPSVMRRVKSRDGFYYYQVGSYKVSQADMDDLVTALVGGDEEKLKAVLKEYQKDEWGYTVFEKKQK